MNNILYRAVSRRGVKPSRPPRSQEKASGRVLFLSIGVVYTALALAGASSSVLAQQASGKAAPGNADAAKGKIAMCAGCHGIENYKTAFPYVYHVPKISGQTPEYLVKALQAYRSGERWHPSMQGIAKQLSDQDMADLAAYYSGK